MEIRDYNGEGKWSAEQIIERYRIYATRFEIEDRRALAPRIYEEGNVQ